MEARERGHETIVATLLEAGADFAVADNIAKARENTEIISIWRDVQSITDETSDSDYSPCNTDETYDSAYSP